MKIVDSFLTRNPCYIANKPLKADGIVIGMVGCPQSGPKVFINNWNRNSANKVCPHVLVGAVGEDVYKVLPYDCCGLIGRPEINETKIGMLLCEPNQLKYRNEYEFDIVKGKDTALELINNTYLAAVKACAEICTELGFDPSTQIKSCVEWTSGGVNARDPDIFWKQAGVEFTMDTFRTDVALYLTEDPSDKDLTESVPEKVVEEPIAEPEVIIEEAVTLKEPDPVPAKPPVTTIRIDVPNLRIRKGPGNGPGCEPIGRYTGVGTFQISEIQNGSGSNTGWGRLTTGDGWVSMDFVEIVNE